MSAPLDSNGRGRVAEFGDFRLDLRTGDLSRHGIRLRLPEQPFRILKMLLAKPGELVTREELRRSLWSEDTFVDFENGLNAAVNRLRETLSDTAKKPRFVETVPRRGYRFIAEVKFLEAAAPPRPDRPVASALEMPTAKPRQGRKWLAVAATFAALLLTTFMAGSGPRHVRGAKAISIHSLAVLPLQNLSDDKDQEYFADGMTDELITDLAQISELRVISRTSVMHYKGTTEKLPQIGHELDADAVVEGTVYRAGDRVRITAQLIDARTDRHLWAHEYERDLRNVLQLQEEVARDIADEIQLKLTLRERTRLASSRPVNAEAHEAYLKGRYYWNQFTEANTRKSLGFFREAIEKDPNYALGYSGLADYYGVMFNRYAAIPQNEACSKAEAAAVKAVEIDDSLAETQSSLAAIRLVCDWDFQGAENRLKQALEINPSYSEAHRLYAILLAQRGQGEQATVEMARAVENDPLSVDLNFVLGWVYYETRHYDQAIMQDRKVIEMDPKRPDGVFGLAGAYAQVGRFDLAIRDYRKTIELLGGKPIPDILSPLAYSYARAGERRKALEILNEMDQMPGVTAMDRAVVYVGLGDKQQALASIEKAYKDREFALADLKSDPVYDPLRSDPRFQELIRRVGL